MLLDRYPTAVGEREIDAAAQVRLIDVAVRAGVGTDGLDEDWRTAGQGLGQK